MNSESGMVDLYAMTRTTHPHGPYLASRIVLCKIDPAIGGIHGWAVWEEITPEDPTMPRFFAQGDYFETDGLSEALVAFQERATYLLSRWERYRKAAA